MNEQEVASADPLNRASVERGVALSSAHDEPGAGTDLSTERDQPVTQCQISRTSPQSRRPGVDVEGPRRESAQGGQTRSVSHYRYNLRSKKNFRTDDYSE